MNLPFSYTFPLFEDKILNLAHDLCLPMEPGFSGKWPKYQNTTVWFGTKADMQAFSDLVEELYNL